MATTAPSSDHAATSGAHTLTDALRRELMHEDHAPTGGQDLDGMARFLLDAAAARNGQVPLIHMEGRSDTSARAEKADGGHRRTQLAFVNDDMPFLVDSIANCLADCGLSIHRLLHPVVGVERDGKGRLLKILAKDSPGARRESWVLVEIDRANARQRARLERELTETLAHVRAAVNDWPEMQRQLSEDAERLADDEAAALFRWLLANNLTQTGYWSVDRKGETLTALGIGKLADPPLLSESSIQAAFDWFEEGGKVPLIIKSNSHSRVHRSTLVDLFITPVRQNKKITALSIHSGLWTSAALATPPDKVPVLRATLRALMEKFDFDSSGHAGKALFHALTALPHDILLTFDRKTLEKLVLTFMSLSDRPRPRLVLARTPLDRHLYAFVWLPRDEISTARRVAIQNMLIEAADAPLLSWSIVLDEGGLGLIRLTLDVRDSSQQPDEELLDRQLKHMVRGWRPAVEAALADTQESRRAAALASRYAGSFPPGYRTGAGPDEAAVDILELHQLKDDRQRRVRLYRNEGDAPSQLRIKLYCRCPITLSDIVPALENYGFRSIEEVTTTLESGRHGHIHRLLLERRDGQGAADLLDRASQLARSIAATLSGEQEDDCFNRLIVSAGLAPVQANLLRALFRYIRQTGSPLAMETVVDTLQAHRQITAQLVALFTATHDPKATKRDSAVEAARNAISTALTDVSVLAEDRILRLFRDIIDATLRTNFFVPAGRDALAFKFDSAKVPGLPQPLPWREIWVYSPRVEGIHLRAGPVARGGLRWSDRRDDFRTEILGLMKAQRVKNAVIVPTGAKGGFYPKQLPSPATDRQAWMEEGTECYRIFIRALLSVTDNMVDGKATHPPHIVIRDEADPYFVVAADKGTATFSDIANKIALEHEFWLGDAFASGGSNGYDHKAMGITARGAWISVQRHFAEMGVDVQSDPIRVAGCGDMSGDVFGNGMLLSQAVKLIAAFDHRHIFLDPDPDPAKSWAERKRLFDLPRSSWDDYDRSLISKGGGVFPRSQKSIPLTPEVRAMLGVEDEAMEPAALIRAILTAQVDLLWFGGIGTYIKAATQSNEQVGDRANDPLRVDAEDLRVSVVGEGANLGVTQAGRIAFALNGGRINTDFIDNSAGVDCSDNEVNIKIALNGEMAHGRLSLEERNVLLTDMTDDVAELVLDDNRAQALALSIAQAGGVADIGSYIRLIEIFESSGRLDRAVEGLAPNDVLQRRGQDGQGLTRPELAVLLSTAKLTLQDAVERGELANDPLLTEELAGAFPTMMQEQQTDAIHAHPLRREIIATELANRLVNRMGPLHPFELAEEEGCSLVDVASAFVIVERTFAARRLWDDIEGANMDERVRIILLSRLATLLRTHMAELIRALPGGIRPTEALTIMGNNLRILARDEQLLGSTGISTRAEAQRSELAEAGVPSGLIDRITAIAQLDGAIGIAFLAARMDMPVADLAHGYMALGEAVGLDWVQSTAGAMEPSDPWERLLVAGVARDMEQIRLDLLSRLGRDSAQAVSGWLDEQQARISQYRQLLTRAKSVQTPNAAMLAELAGQARALLAR